MTDELIRKYADEIERIIRDNTMGDYTWNGLLFSFLREVDESRTLKYEVEAEPKTVTGYVVAKVEDGETRYYDIQTLDEKLGWTVLSSRLSYEIASKIVRSLADDISFRLVDHGEPLPGEETLYDIQHKPDDEWLTYRRDLSFKQARDIVQSFVWDSEIRIVPSGENEPEPEKTYDVHVHDGWWRILESNVSKERADELVKGLRRRYIIEEHDDGGPIYDGDEVPDGCDKW